MASSWIEKLLAWAAKMHGKNDREYLVCRDCETSFPVGPIVVDPDTCNVCGGELYIVLPDEDMLVINWRSWKANQQWWPQKWHVWDGDNTYSYWAFVGKRWFKRPEKGIFDRESDAEEV